MLSFIFFPNDERGWHSNIQRHGIPINNDINDDEDIGDDLEGTHIITFLILFKLTNIRFCTHH